MTDSDLDQLYKRNSPESHAAALRGIFDAGYALGANAPAADVSEQVSAADAAAEVPTVDTP